MSSETERTDVIRWLRPDDTPPLGMPLPPGGRHRARHGGAWSRPALVALFGIPSAGVAFTVGLLAPGWFGAEPGPVTAPPSRTEAAPSSAPLPPLPTPTRVDRPRTRAPHRPVVASPTRTASPTASPSPTPTTPATPTPGSATSTPAVQPSPTPDSPVPTTPIPPSEEPLND